MVAQKIIWLLVVLLCSTPAFSRVLTGIEVLRAQNFAILEGKRVGLVTNATGVDAQLRSTVDILFEAPNVNLVALYAPEHGVRGQVYAGTQVQDDRDERTGLQVYSLYGKTRKPTAAMLQNVDVLVYDIQDIGCRSYTFISTIGLVMQAAAENNKEVIILDRPNPLGGLKIEGSYVQKGYFSFVSQYKIPYIYGLTCGELAQFINEDIHCNLTVVKMQNWSRKMRFEDTGLPWVPTSPQIPYTESCQYYPATGIVGEMGWISIGVGYTLPFQVMAAPWVKAQVVADSLNALQLPGVTFRPIVYKPYFNAHQNQLVQGVQLYIQDYEQARLSEIQFYVAQTFMRLYPDHPLFSEATAQRNAMFDKVCGTNQIRLHFQANYKVEDILPIWRQDEEDFRAISKNYWLYQE